MRPRLVFTIVAVMASSFLPGGDCSASSVFRGRKFESWFDTYGHHFERSSVSTCNRTLEDYIKVSSGVLVSKFVVAHHVDCVLANTSETIKANMASAGVTLALMPSLLSSLGPTLAESSTLVLERPVLSLLLTVAAPASYPFRPCGHQDPLEPSRQPFRRLRRVPSSWWAQVLISLLQYLMALAAATNVVAASLELGIKTVVTFTFAPWSGFTGLLQRYNTKQSTSPGDNS